MTRMFMSTYSSSSHVYRSICSTKETVLMYFTGLETMHALTSDGRPYELRVEISDEYGNTYYESYADFSIGPGKTFVLHIGQATGTAGNG